jgi:hypothetical protein
MDALTDMNEKNFDLIFSDSLEEFSKVLGGQSRLDLSKADSLAEQVKQVQTAFQNILPNIKFGIDIDIVASNSKEGLPVIEVWGNREQQIIPGIQILDRTSLFDLLEKENNRKQQMYDKKHMLNKPLKGEESSPQSALGESNNENTQDLINPLESVNELPIRITSISTDRRHIFTQTIRDPGVPLLSPKFISNNLNDLELAVVAYLTNAECKVSYIINSNDRNTFIADSEITFPDSIIELYKLLNALKRLGRSNISKTIKQLYEQVENQMG